MGHPTARTYLAIYGWLLGLTVLEVSVVMAGWPHHLTVSQRPTLSLQEMEGFIKRPLAGLPTAVGPPASSDSIEVVGGLRQVVGWPQGAIVTLLISTALAKALLIALYFMHLKFDRPVVWLLPGIPVLLGIVFVLALFPDVVFHLVQRM